MCDRIFEDSRKRHLMTVGFLKMLKDNFVFEEAFDLASQGFANYMIGYYNLVLSDTESGSQERFEKFRAHYSQLASESPYLQIVESAPGILKACFTRCPFVEVMKHYDLEQFSWAFCLSDAAFTEAVLPGVRFLRSHTISKGDDCCDHTWVCQLNK